MFYFSLCWCTNNTLFWFVLLHFREAAGCLLTIKCEYFVKEAAACGTVACACIIHPYLHDSLELYCIIIIIRSTVSESLLHFYFIIFFNLVRVNISQLSRLQLFRKLRIFSIKDRSRFAVCAKIKVSVSHRLSFFSNFKSDYRTGHFFVPKKSFAQFRTFTLLADRFLAVFLFENFLEK